MLIGDLNCDLSYPELVNYCIYKSINNYPPEYLRDLFRLRENIKNLRGVNKLQVRKPNTTRYGKNTVKYLAAII